MPPADDLLVTRAGAVVTVTFNRPQVRNALTLAMYDSLESVMLGVQAEDGVRAVVVTGAGGKAFASGTDVAELLKIRDPEQALAYERRGARLVEAIEACPLPTLAVIDGACVGGGLAIAAACDLRLATRASTFGMPMARTMGNCLSLASHALLAALVGAGPLKRMIFTAQLWSAEEAHRHNLVDEVLEDHAALAARGGELAALVASHAPLTLRATKQMLRWLRTADAPAEAELVASVYGSADFAEGLAAFAGKRKPRWQGG